MKRNLNLKLIFLKDITRDVVNESRIKAGEVLARNNKNRTGMTLIRPGGRNCYPSFWIRDFAMSLESNLISTEELKDLLLLTANGQNGQYTLHMHTNAIIPPFAIPDHINLDGRPVFFPGTYSSGLDQGGGAWGFRPPFDNQYYFIDMAYDYVRRSKDIELLNTEVNGITLFNRLCLAFEVPPCDDCGIILTEAHCRGVNFGFYDSIQHTGYLLFASLLKYRAALHLSFLSEVNNSIGSNSDVVSYKSIAEDIRNAIPGIFSTSSGWLNASTGIGKQADVWGTLFAVYIGALADKNLKNALEAIHKAYNMGLLSYRGNVRHILSNSDYSSKSAWESAITPVDTYQNGAFWGTATGWLMYSLHQVDNEAFTELVDDYIGELIEGDYRKGGSYGSPWECFHFKDGYHQNPVYMTSVTLPYSALIRLGFYNL